MLKVTAYELHKKIESEGIPIVSCDKNGFKLAESATSSQQSRAAQIFNEFDWSAPAPIVVDQDQERIKEILGRFDAASPAERWEAVLKFIRKRI